jgi:hypothetical protein
MKDRASLAQAGKKINGDAPFRPPSLYHNLRLRASHPVLRTCQSPRAPGIMNTVPVDHRAVPR